MAVLVTGGAGFIGSHMVMNLADAGEEVVVLDDLSTGFDWAVDGRAGFETGDAGDMALVRRLIAKHGIREVIHFAGSIIVPESVADPLRYYANNAMVSRNLIEAAATSGVRHFIFSSTAAVYGMPGSTPAVEETPLAPISPYGRSKLMTEWMLEDAARVHPLTYGVLRYFCVAGADPGGRGGESTAVATHLIKVAVQAALGRRDGIEIFGTDYDTPDGTCVRDYIHVSDLIAAHALLLGRLRAGGGSTTLNCAYGRGYSVREVIDTVRQVSGADFPAVEAPRRPGDPPYVTATGARIREVLGWRPQHDDLAEIVRHSLDWERRLMTRNRAD